MKFSKSKIAQAGPKNNNKKLLGNPPNENEVSKNVSLLENKNWIDKNCFAQSNKEALYGQILRQLIIRIYYILKGI